MPIADILIAIAVVISVLIGFVRGFVKEAISIASLLIAIWAAIVLGPQVGEISDQWLSSVELQIWFGRVLIFVVVLTIGGLISWGLAKLVRLSILSGTDRVLGMFFGFCRGALLVGLSIIGGQYAGFDNDSWWDDSIFVPYGEHVAEWIVLIAPKGLELIDSSGFIDDLAADRSGSQFKTRRA
jgi:membrane protein required for colicin V production